MVSGISGLPVSDFSGTVGICHPDGYHYRRPCQRSCALDDLYGITVSTVGVGKNGGYHCRLIYLVQETGRIRSQPESLQIHHDSYRTGLSAYCTGKPFNSHAAIRSCMYDDVHRAGIFQETVRYAGANGTCRHSGCGNTNGHSRKDTAQYTGTSPFRDLAEPCFRLLRE